MKLIALALMLVSFNVSGSLYGCVTDTECEAAQAIAQSLKHHSS